MLDIISWTLFTSVTLWISLLIGARLVRVCLNVGEVVRLAYQDRAGLINL